MHQLSYNSKRLKFITKNWPVTPMVFVSLLHSKHIFPGQLLGNLPGFTAD